MSLDMKVIHYTKVGPTPRIAKNKSRLLLEDARTISALVETTSVWIIRSTPDPNYRMTYKTAYEKVAACSNLGGVAVGHTVTVFDEELVSPLERLLGRKWAV